MNGALTRVNETNGEIRPAPADARRVRAPEDDRIGADARGAHAFDLRLIAVFEDESSACFASAVVLAPTVPAHCVGARTLALHVPQYARNTGERSRSQARCMQVPHGQRGRSQLVVLCTIALALAFIALIVHGRPRRIRALSAPGAVPHQVASTPPEVSPAPDDASGASERVTTPRERRALPPGVTPLEPGVSHLAPGTTAFPAGVHAHPPGVGAFPPGI